MLLLLQDCKLAREEGLGLLAFSEELEELLAAFSAAEAAAAALALAAAAALTLVLGPHLGQLMVDCSRVSLLKVLSESDLNRSEQPAQRWLQGKQRQHGEMMQPRCNNSMT